MKTNSPVVLSIYPNKWGFGYVVLEQPQTLIDYAMVAVKRLQMTSCSIVLASL